MIEIFTLIGEITTGVVAVLGVAVGLALLAGAAWSTYAAFVGAKDWVALSAIDRFTGMTSAERRRLERAARHAAMTCDISVPDCQKLIRMLHAMPDAFKWVDEADADEKVRDERRDAEREAERKQWEEDYDH